jgi:hypothetical protein
LVIPPSRDIPPPVLGLQSIESNPQSQTNRRPAAESPAPLAPATQRTQGRQRGVLGSSPRPTAPDGRSGTAVVRRARPASGGAPDTAAVSQIPPRSLRYRRGLSDTSPVSRQTEPISQQNPAALAATTQRTLLLSVAQDTQGAQGTQDTTRRAAPAHRAASGTMPARGRRCGSSASMLCSRDSLRSCRSTTSTVVVRERSYTTHDTAPVSQILSQYPGILRRYRRYQGGIPAVLCPADPVALATSHTTNCCTGHGGRRIEQYS